MLFPLSDDNPTRRKPVATAVIIALNLVTLLTLANLETTQQRFVTTAYGFVPLRLSALLEAVPRPIDIPLLPARAPQVDARDAAVNQKLVIRFEPHVSSVVFSMITAMFLHGGWLHLLSNMWFLWIFGNNIEDELGAFGYLCLYLLGGIGASLCHWAMVGVNSSVPVIGASGAVAVMLGAYAVRYPKARVRCLLFLFIFITVIELPAIWVLIVWFLGQLLEGFGVINMHISGGVAWWAHIGGFVLGMLLIHPFATFFRRLDQYRLQRP